MCCWSRTKKDKLTTHTHNTGDGRDANPKPKEGRRDERLSDREGNAQTVGVGRKKPHLPATPVDSRMSKILPGLHEFMEHCSKTSAWYMLVLVTRASQS